MRLLYLLQFGYPQKKLLIMGQEFGQRSEWDAERPLPWESTWDHQHRCLQWFVKRLNEVYRYVPGMHDGDNIHIGKHKIKVDTSGDAPVPWDSGRKAAAPRIDETMVLDTKERRKMLQQAAAMGESMQFAGTRMKVPTLVVLSGNTNQREYVLTNKLTVIGKSAMATVRLQGWFKPQMAAQINQLDDGYYLGAGDKVPSINGRPISGPVRLSDGDLVEVSGVRLNFIFRE